MLILSCMMKFSRLNEFQQLSYRILKVLLVIIFCCSLIQTLRNATLVNQIVRLLWKSGISVVVVWMRDHLGSRDVFHCCLLISFSNREPLFSWRIAGRKWLIFPLFLSIRFESPLTTSRVCKLTEFQNFQLSQVERISFSSLFQWTDLLKVNGLTVFLKPIDRCYASFLN